MDDYLGILVRESLRDPSMTPPVIASRRGTEWTLLLVRIPAGELHREAESLRSNLDRTDCWYAHLFRDDELDFSPRTIEGVEASFGLRDL